MNGAIKTIVCSSALVLLGSLLVHGLGQQSKKASESAVKMRDLIRKIDEAKTEEEEWLLALRVVKFIESDEFDADAAKVLLEAELEILRTVIQFEDTPPPAWTRSRGTISTLLRSHRGGYAWQKFVKLIVPLLESDGDEDLSNFAARTAAEFYAAGDASELNEWIYKYLDAGKAPPRQFLDLAFSKNPEQVYANLLHGVVKIEDGKVTIVREVISRVREQQIGPLNILADNAIKRCLDLDYILSYTTSPEVRKEITSLLEADKERARRFILGWWSIDTEIISRRYLLEYVRRKPNLFLTVELMKLMRQEKHEAIEPLVKELEKEYARLFPEKP